MRVLYLMQYFVPPNGAWSTRSYEFARELIARGHEVTVITSNGMLPDEYSDLKQTTQVEISGVPCVVIPVPYATGMPFLQRVKGYLRFTASAFKAIAQQPADLVFASSSPLPIAIPGIWAKVRHRIPLVFEVRDLWPEMPIALGQLRNPILKFLARLLEKVVYHLSSQIIALSPDMTGSIEQRGVSRERIVTIPNLADTRAFNVPEAEGDRVRQGLAIDSNSPLVVYAGSFGLVHEVSYLVDVAASMSTLLPEAKFVLVGNGVNREHLIEQAQKLGILNRSLRILDPVARTELPPLLAASTLVTSLVIPLKPAWKNSANKFFDALAAGKPIAINYGGWQAELIEETGAGIVMPPGDPEKGAQVLAEFLSDQVSLEQASKAARQLAERFSRDVAAGRFVSVLEQVANSGIRNS